jgi:hypothetical protein
MCYTVSVTEADSRPSAFSRTISAQKIVAKSPIMVFPLFSYFFFASAFGSVSFFLFYRTAMLDGI